MNSSVRSRTSSSMANATVCSVKAKPADNQTAFVIPPPPSSVIMTAATTVTTAAVSEYAVHARSMCALSPLVTVARFPLTRRSHQLMIQVIKTGYRPHKRAAHRKCRLRLQPPVHQTAEIQKKRGAQCPRQTQPQVTSILDCLRRSLLTHHAPV